MSAVAVVSSVARAAEVTISGSRTTPVSTSTADAGAPADVTITGSASISLSSGVAATLDSANTLTNNGSISINDADNATGVLITAPSGAFTNSGSILLLEDYSPSETDPFALGVNRIGTRLQGASSFTGNLTFDEATFISIEGNDSRGISIESALTGDLSVAGAIGMVGDDSHGISITAPVTGNIDIDAGISAKGQNSTGISIFGTVDGRVRLAGEVAATGYRSTSHPSDSAFANYTAADKWQSGPTVWIGSDITGGALFDAPTSSNSSSGTATLTSYSSAPALLITPAGVPSSITIGELSGSETGYSFLNRGTIAGDGVLNGFTATGMRVEDTAFTNIVGNTGTIAALTYDANATGLALGSGALLPELENSGTIRATAQNASAASVARAIALEPGAEVTSLVNSGTITATVNGAAASATALYAAGNGIATIENSGTIKAAIVPENSSDTITGDAVAIDLSNATLDVTVRQLAPSAGTPSIVGDVLFGSGADTLDLQAGTLAGDISFASGSDALLISGGAALKGTLSDSDGQLAINVSNGSASLTNPSTFSLSSLSVGTKGKVVLRVSPGQSAIGSLDVSGAASFASGGKLTFPLDEILNGDQAYRLLSAGTLIGTPEVGFDNNPYLYTIQTNVQTGTNGYIDATVHRKSASEVGFAGNRASAFESVLAAVSHGDENLRQAFVSSPSQSTFIANFDPYLPHVTGVELELLMTSTQAFSQAMLDRLARERETDKSVRFWAQEVAYGLGRQANSMDEGYRATGFGFLIGLDGDTSSGGILGFSYAYSADDMKERAGSDKRLARLSHEVSVYFAQPLGRLLFSWRLGVGLDSYTVDRRLSLHNYDTGADVTANAIADYSGKHAIGSFKASYLAGAGKLELRPELALDIVGLKENGYQETGGSSGVDLALDKSSGVAGAGTALVAFGLPSVIGGLSLRPELQIGARYRRGLSSLDTTARFVNVGNTTMAFTAVDTDGLSGVVGLALTGFGAEGSGGLETLVDFGGGEIRASLRLAFRLSL